MNALFNLVYHCDSLKCQNEFLLMYVLFLDDHDVHSFLTHSLHPPVDTVSTTQYNIAALIGHRKKLKACFYLSDFS